jgi:hypothetical protein
MSFPDIFCFICRHPCQRNLDNIVMAGIRPYVLLGGEKLYIIGASQSNGTNVLHFFGQSCSESEDDVTCPIRTFLRNFFGLDQPPDELIRACAERLETVSGEFVREIELSKEEIENFKPNPTTDSISSISVDMKDNIKRAYLESKGKKTFRLKSFGDRIFHLNPMGLF